MALRVLEACLLMGMGGFMYWLSMSSVYWQFMNPKYSWLTSISGFLLFAVGCACLSDAHRRRTTMEIVFLTMFFCLAGTSLYTDDYFAMSGGTVEGSLSQTFADAVGQPDTGEPVVEVDGKAYVKVNSAELLLGEEEGLFKVGDRVAVQGVLVRSEEMDRAGLVGVGRLMIACCFADSVGAAALVRVDDPADYEDATWVRVLGTVQEKTEKLEGIVKIQGALTAARSDRFVLAADAVEPHPVEGTPFIFETRDAQPFAY